MKKISLMNKLIAIIFVVMVIFVAGNYYLHPLISAQTGAAENGQSGKASVILINSGGSLSSSQQVSVNINAGILRQQIMTDLVFAKIVVSYDSSVIELTSDPQLVSSDWQNPIFAQTKSEAENKNLGKVILVAGVSGSQQPIDYASKFAKLTFKKKSSGLKGVTEIKVLTGQSQIVNTPAQDTTISVSNLTLNL